MLCKFRTSEFREFKVSIFLTSLLVNPWTTDARWKNVPHIHVGSCLETFYNISNSLVWIGKNPMTCMFALFLKLRPHCWQAKLSRITRPSSHCCSDSTVRWSSLRLHNPARDAIARVIKYACSCASRASENILKPLSLPKCFRKVVIYEQNGEKK